MNEGEKKVVRKMIGIYCRSKHDSSGVLCKTCAEMEQYALSRLENCPFGENKPTCNSCSIHCYRSDMKQKIKEIMRFSGPKMLFIHPIDTIRHFHHERKRNNNYKAALK